MPPLVSIIVPVYNVQRYLCECIDSVLRQTYADLEIILVNDGSTDDSGKICDSYAERDQRVRVVHQSNKGVSVARNTGLDTATGTYVQFVDSDDWLEPKMTEVLVREMQTPEDVQLVHCSFEEWRCLGNAPPTRIKRPFVPGIKSARDFAVLPDMNLPGAIQRLQEMSAMFLKLFQRSVIERFGLRFQTGLPTSEDTLFGLSYMIRIHRLRTVAEPLYHHRVVAGSLSNSFQSARSRIVGIDPLYRALSNLLDEWAASECNEERRKEAFRNLNIYLAYDALAGVMRPLLRGGSMSLRELTALFRLMLDQDAFGESLSVYRPPKGFCRSVPFFLRRKKPWLAACAAKVFATRKKVSLLRRFRS